MGNANIVGSVTDSKTAEKLINFSSGNRYVFSIAVKPTNELHKKIHSMIK